ncbi:rhomboid family intramembrane serine protease [Seongchinamella unica]|uniref:Rhomboid family intramembrane serine protease n=1 Tax=Seongchinamella unica TaxID=2547392 RepID=A0A4R5LNG8_9GAMM|nr:rhomboid family intramembrane serine protease [Seongchinamella unica]TDG11897.1 rhomboid family intramembrane serine protease [Seongchinamella unica]
MSRRPVFTLILCALACGLALLPAAARENLHFDYYRLVTGDWIGLLSGHWLHADVEHLAWNVGALAILASLIERHSPQLLMSSILAGTLGVDLLLVSPLGEVARYCGLSGLLNTLLGVVLFLLWQRTRSLLVILVGLLCTLKILVEIRFGQSLFTDISWPPYAPAHLAGLVATPIALALGYRDTVRQKTTTGTARTHYGHLVTSA